MSAPIPSPPPDASPTLRGLVNLAAQTFAGVKTFANGIVATLVSSAEADGPAAVAHILDTAAAFVTAGAKLLQIRNNGTDKLTVDKDGALSIPGFNFSVNGAGVTIGRITTPGVTGQTYAANKSDTAAAVAHDFDNTTTLTDAAALLARWRNNGSSKFALDKDGKAVFSDGSKQAIAGAPSQIVWSVATPSNGTHLAPGYTAAGLPNPIQVPVTFAGECRAVRVRVRTPSAADTSFIVSKNGADQVTVTVLGAANTGVQTGTPLFTVAAGDYLGVRTTLVGAAPVDCAVTISLNAAG